MSPTQRANMTAFEVLCQDMLGTLHREYKFHPTRRWKFDYAFPDHNPPIALEVEGGTWRRGGGAHRGTGFLRDIEKYNEAAILGWVVIRCVPEQRDDGSVLETLRRLKEVHG